MALPIPTSLPVYNVTLFHDRLIPTSRHTHMAVKRVEQISAVVSATSSPMALWKGSLETRPPMAPAYRAMARVWQRGLPSTSSRGTLPYGVAVGERGGVSVRCWERNGQSLTQGFAVHLQQGDAPVRRGCGRERRGGESALEVGRRVTSCLRFSKNNVLGHIPVFIATLKSGATFSENYS